MAHVQFPLPAGQGRNKPLYLEKTPEKAIDLLNGGPASPCNTPPTAPVDNGGIPSLPAPHGVDDRLDAHEFFFSTQPRLTGDALHEPTASRQHAQDLLERSHFFKSSNLVSKILQGEGPSPPFFFQFSALLLPDGLLCTLDERKHIA